MDFRAYEATPGISVIVRPDAPVYTHVAVSNDFIKAFGMIREDVIGQSHFSTFPKSPDDPDFTGEQNLKASFAYITANKVPHEIAVQRYDVPNGDGTFSQKYWKINNAPILSDAGDVLYIIHSATEITEQVKAAQNIERMKPMQQALNLFMQAPVPIQIYKGRNLILELVNGPTLTYWGKQPDIIGKPLMEALPELNGTGYPELLLQVMETNETRYLYDAPVTFMVNGKRALGYYNSVFVPYYEEGDEKATGVLVFGFDVTQRMLAQKRIVESDLKYRTLFESMDQGFCIIELIFDGNNQPRDYRFLEYNPVFEKQTGLKQAIGKTARELVPNLEAHWFERYGKVALTGEPVRFIDGAQAMDRIFEVYAFKIEGDESRKVALLFTDITEQRKAEQKIRESEERFRNLADDSPIFIFIIDASLEAPVSYWNKTWVEYTGQVLGQAVGTAWNNVIHPDDIHMVVDHYVPAFQKKQSYFIPAMRVKRHDGEYRWHAFKGNPRYLPNGDFNGYVGVGFDIHEQKTGEHNIKQSEARLQSKVTERTAELETQKNLLDNILANSSNGISVTEMIRDAHGEIIDANTIMANDAAVKYIGLPKEIFLSKTALELDPNILNSPYGQACLKTLQTGEPALIQYYMDITGRWQELTISKMDEDHLIHIFTDVTPVKESQLQLERTVEELRRSNANLEEFAHAASHDLKEPIRKVHVFSNMLKTSFPALNAEQQHLFERVEDATQRMGLLVDDLLDYSHVSMGVNMVEEIDLNKKVRIVLRDLEIVVQEKGAQITVGKLPKIKGQRRQLQQLFHNLIQNALKYSKKEVTPQIAISSELITGNIASFELMEDEKNRTFHLITVQDNGIGFEQDHAEQIFLMFKRLHGRSEYGGSGVGLAIVKKVVENHKGYIRAEGKPGAGAIFKILLPAE